LDEGEPWSDDMTSDQEEDGNQIQEEIQEDESAVKDRGKLNWLRIGGHP